MMCLATVEHQYLSGSAGLICGEDTAAQIDQEVLAVINTCYNNAYQMLEENKEVLDKISEYLFEKETITGKEFMQMFREIKGLPEPEENAADKTQQNVMEENTNSEKKDEFLEVLTEMTEAQKNLEGRADTGMAKMQQAAECVEEVTKAQKTVEVVVDETTNEVSGNLKELVDDYFDED